MPASERIAAELAALGVDETQSEYVTALLLDDPDDLADLRETLVAVLAESAGADDDSSDDAALEACVDRLFAAAGLVADRAAGNGDNSHNNTAAASTVAPSLLQAPVTMAALSKANTEAAVSAQQCLFASSMDKAAKDGAAGASSAGSAAASSASSSAGSSTGKGKRKKHKGGKGGKKGGAGSSGAGSATSASSASDAVLDPTASDVVVSAQESRFFVDTGEGTTIGEVDLKNVGLEIGGKVLLAGTHLQLLVGRRYGLVGRNGVGKTTLMRTMSQGRIAGWPRSLVTVMVDQENVGDARSALRTVVEANAELRRLWADEQMLRDAAAAAGGASVARAAVLRLRWRQSMRQLIDVQAYKIKMSGERGHRARELLVEAEATEARTRRLANLGLRLAGLSESVDVAELDGSTPSQTAAAGEGEGEPAAEGEAKGGSAGQSAAGEEDLARLLAEHKALSPTESAIGGSASFGGATTLSTVTAAVDASIPQDWQTELVARLAELSEALRFAGAESAEAEAKRILSGLGFTTDMMQAATATLSGGWRMRTALARALFVQPHILLLDEPTNALDIYACVWLERYLAEEMLETTVLVVSHDREFLDNVCTDIIHFKSQNLRYHDGNYSTFEERMEQLNIMKGRQAEAIAKHRKKLEDQISQWERDARKAGNDKQLKQVASRRKKLERTGMERNAKGHRFKLNRDRVGYYLSTRGDVDLDAPEPPVTIELGSPPPLGYYGPVLQLENLTTGYDGKPLVTGITMNIELTSRIGLLGVNGEGKSTLLATIAGALPPVSGLVKTHPRLRVAYFSQHCMDELPMDATPLGHLLATHPGLEEHKARGHLGGLGISSDIAIRPIRTLSGGQRARVGFALLTAEPPHILLADEPTSHLDLHTVEALSLALQAFAGGLVLVSHDRRFIEEICDDYYLIEGERCEHVGEQGLEHFVSTIYDQIGAL